MQLILLLFVSGLSFLGRTNCDKAHETAAPEVPPARATVLADLEDVEVTKNETSPEIHMKCKQTNYRSYIKCLLEENKRRKRQCGSNCAPQSCSGSGCPRVTGQFPCTERGCDNLTPNCVGVGCVQSSPTCYGGGCVPTVNVQPPCAGFSGCGTVQRPVVAPETPVKIDTTELSREIAHVRSQLREVKDQNNRLIDLTERATSLILQSVNRPVPEPKVIREPFLVEHNLTTNIDISNYLNNNNVINVPSTPEKPPEEPKTHCCTVVRPKTCRRAPRPPYIVCGNRRHRTCGSHCSGRRVIHSHVRPGCGEDSTENCVGYGSHPHYQTSGYYPPMMPIYYPPMYPMFAPPQPSFTSGDDEVYVMDEECEDCESEEVTEDCEDQSEGCRRIAKKGGVRHHGPIQSRSVPLAELDQVKKEAMAIKRSEDQLTTSLDMLKEAVELETIEKNREDDADSGKEMEASSTSPESD